MKSRSLLLGLALSLLHFTVSAQSYSFKVLVNKGKNEMKAGNNWQAIKVGASLTENDEIKIGSNAYVGLVHVSGKPIELKEVGSYKVADLTRKVSTGASVITKYTDFILSSNQSTKNNMQATGAVHRGPNNISVYLPVKSELAVFYNSEQIITWDNHEMKGPFTVTFTTLFDDVLKTEETAENNVSVDLNSPEFQNEDNVLVTVVSKVDKKESNQFTLKRLSKADKTRIENLLNEISAATAEETAMSKYILAGFYESHNLFIDAATAYQEAIKLAPDVGAYQEYYNDFLLRTGIKEGHKK